MSKFVVNTNQIKISGENIQKYASKYNEVIENMFTTIKNLELNGVWVGDSEKSSVKKYISYSLKDKKNYTDFAIAINNFGKVLVEYAKYIESVCDESI